jgi:4-hydroxybenzoate polyprenyltransferase
MYLSFNLFAVQPKIELMAVAFFVTLSIYMFNKKTDIKEDSINMPERTKIAQLKFGFFVSICAYTLAMIFGGLEKNYFTLILLVPLLTGILYSTKIGNIRIKEILLVKNIIIASSCSIIATMPFFYTMDQEKFIFIFSFFLLKLFVNTIIFDIRDRKGDKLYEINTIPLKIGIKHTKNLLYSINTIIFAIIIFGIYSNIFTNYYYILLISIIYAYFYIHISNRLNNKLFYDLLIDGEWIYLGIIAYVFNIIL